MGWPVDDLLDDLLDRAAPLLSPFTSSGGGGVSTFLGLSDVPNSFVGHAAKAVVVNATEDALEFVEAGGGFAPDNVYIVSPAGDLTSFDSVAYTSVQTALDAANTATPTVTDQYTVFVMPGLYDEQIMTMYQYVHIVGMQASMYGNDASGRGPVTITLGSASVASPGLSSAADSSISNIAFAYNGQTVHTNFMEITDKDFSFFNCGFYNTSSTDVLNVTTGHFIDCSFTNVEMDTAGTQDLPAIYQNCEFNWGSNPARELTITGASFFYNCVARIDSTYNAAEFIDGNSILAKWIGGAIYNIDGGNFSWMGLMLGVDVFLEMDGTLASHVTDMLALSGGAQIINCNFELDYKKVGNETTVGMIQIENFTNGDIVFHGNNVYVQTAANTQNALFWLDNSISSDGELIISNNKMVLSKNVIDIHASGYATETTITLSGNSIDCMQAAMPVNAGAGTLHWKGSDVQARFYPASAEWGTGTASENDDFPGVLLDAAAETAYLIARANPPAGLLVDAGLVLSAKNSDGYVDLPFTDTDTTALATHDADWTVTGTITIVSNAANATASSGTQYAIHAHTAKNGFATVTPVTGTGSGTQEAGIIFRWADVNNYWRLTKVDDDPEFRLTKKVAGVDTVMHSDNSSLTGALAVSFNGNRIRVYEAYNSVPRVVAEVYDTDLEDNTGVGIILMGNAGRTKYVDDFKWWPGGDVDMTIDTRQAHLHEGFPQAATSSVDTGVDVLHSGYSIHDVDFGETEDLSNVKVTLDVLNGNITEVYVHGLVVRHWNLQNYLGEGTFRGLGDDQTPGHSILGIR